MKKTLKYLAMIITIIIVLIISIISLTACDSGITQGIILTRGEQMEVITAENGSLQMHPFAIGYYVQVAECDSDKNIILDKNGKQRTAWFRTTNMFAFDKIKVGDVWTLSEDWQEYSSTPTEVK